MVQGLGFRVYLISEEQLERRCHAICRHPCLGAPPSDKLLRDGRVEQQLLLLTLQVPIYSLGFRVKGLGFRVRGLGFRV
jgi:hypothetical protein